MADLSELFPDVLTHLSGASEATVLAVPAPGAKQFCQDSRIWAVSMGTKDIDAPDDLSEFSIVLPEADLTIPDQSYINSVESVEIDNIGIDPKYYRYDVVSKTLTLNADTFRDTVTMEVYVVLETLRSSSTAPDFLLERWGEGIGDYALWEMMRMKGREWSDQRNADVYKMKYEQRVAEAKVEKAREGTGNAIEMPPIPFV